MTESEPRLRWLAFRLQHCISRLFFEGDYMPSYEVARDGQRFVMRQEREPNPPPSQLIACKILWIMHFTNIMLHATLSLCLT